VLQEILHRYVSIHRLDAVEPAMRSIIEIVDQVFPIERTDVELARDIVLEARLYARDAIHVAVMRRRGVDRIMSFDRGFDQVPGIVRIGD
jgi:predicted nucleic acid-binding protein